MTLGLGHQAPALRELDPIGRLGQVAHHRQQLPAVRVAAQERERLRRGHLERPWPRADARGSAWRSRSGGCRTAAARRAPGGPPGRASRARRAPRRRGRAPARGRRPVRSASPAPQEQRSRSPRRAAAPRASAIQNARPIPTLAGPRMSASFCSAWILGQQRDDLQREGRGSTPLPACRRRAGSARGSAGSAARRARRPPPRSGASPAPERARSGAGRQAAQLELSAEASPAKL